MISLTILGSNSALPAHGRHPTAQILQTPDGNILIDCGEGTQMQLSKYKIKTSKIKCICISHLHGDHYFGLSGLLNSMALLGRTDELHLIGPAKLWDILQLQFEASEHVLPYLLHFTALENVKAPLQIMGLNIMAFETDHRIPTWGFTFRQNKNALKLNAAALEAHGVPRSFYSKLYEGEDYIDETGRCIANKELTIPAANPKMYAYCADTKFTLQFLEAVQQADLLYHETTFLNEAQQRATDRYHSSCKDAATLALKANAKKLIIGHFSSKYDELERFETEAKEIFEHTELALEGCCFIF